MKNFDEFGIKIPEILLPSNIDLQTWSVIACDQYTQDKEYWQKVESLVGNKPSTYHITLPEIYLQENNRKERINNIQTTMKEYLADDIFESAKKEFIYIERKTAYNRVRHGLLACVDLETYEWKPFSTSFIRATEATIVERIPPRKEIRQGAVLESPHIMLLVDDTRHILVEGAAKLAKDIVYDGDLMLNGGHITGWALNTDEQFDYIYNALSELKKQHTDSKGNTFLFAVGDGNHSLATAKAVWDEYKAKNNVLDAPARYAMVEIVNIYDSGLTFEPIHRVLFNVQAERLIKYVQNELNAEYYECSSKEELEEKVLASSFGFGFAYAQDNKEHYIFINAPIQKNIDSLAVSYMQPVLDKYIAEAKKDGQSITIDYIHGSKEVFRLGSMNNNVSILMPPIKKESFFNTIMTLGPLPRKSFSMGEADEKRFYLECRKLFA